MTDLEQQLRRHLQRVDPPDGFAERVLARAASERHQAGNPQTSWWKAVAAAFLLGALCGGWLMHQQHSERQQALETRQQFVQAMRITNRSLEQAGRKLTQATEKGDAQ